LENTVHIRAAFETAVQSGGVTALERFSRNMGNLAMMLSSIGVMRKLVYNPTFT
jgi:uncharacterized membrane protein